MTRGSYFRRAREGVVLFLLFALPLVLSPLGYQYIKEVFVLAIVSFLVILWAVEIFVKGEENIRIPLPLLGGLLLLAMASLSLIHSGNPLIGQESFGLLLFFLLFYLLLVNIISSECQARRLLGALFLAGTLAAIYALMQYFGFDLLPYPHRLSPAGPGSMVSTMGNKNYLAGFLSYLFLPALILLLKSRGWWRLAIFISLGVIYTTILASGTRGAWLGLAVAIFFLAMAYFRFRLAGVVKRNLRWLTALVTMLALITALFTFPTPLSERSSIPQRVTSGVKALGGTYIRYRAWWTAWEMVKEQPLFGIGLGGYKLEYFNYNARFLRTDRGKVYKDVEAPKADQAHNEYIQFWAELGSLGLLAGLLLIGSIFYSSWRNLGMLRVPDIKSKRKRAAMGEEVQWKRFIILALQAGIIALLIHAFFSFPLHLPASALLLVNFAAILECRYLRESPLFTLTLGRRSSIALSLALLLLAIITSTFTIRDFTAELYLQRGEKLLREGHEAEAKQYLERSLKLDFAPKMVLFDLGYIYMDTDLDRAEQLFLRSLDSPIVGQSCYLNLVQIARAQGDYEKALKYAEQGMEINPANLEFTYSKALIYTDMGEVTKSVELLEELIEAPDGYYRALAYTKLGKLYRLDGFKEKAVQSYRRARQEIEAELEGLRKWQGKKVSREKHAWFTERYGVLHELYGEVVEALGWLES